MKAVQWELLGWSVGAVLAPVLWVQLAMSSAFLHRVDGHQLSVLEEVKLLQGCPGLDLGAIRSSGTEYSLPLYEMKPSLVIRRPMVTIGM